MERIAMLFTLLPVLRGFAALVISGTCFPLCGVMVLRLNLVPLRYMLMHGVILGGAVALALSLPLVPVTVAINILLILLMMVFTKNTAYGFGGGSAAAMVISMALASVIMHVADVPAKDTLNLLWGSPFALTNVDLIVLALLALLLAAYVIGNFRNILTLFFNQEIAKSLGLHVRFHYTVMVLIIALVVALAMKLLGAFLIDALLILPVLSASSFLSLGNKTGTPGTNGTNGTNGTGNKNHGIKKLCLASCITGCIFSVAGYTVAVMVNWPPAGTIAMVAGASYLCGYALNAMQHIRRNKKQRR